MIVSGELSTMSGCIVITGEDVCCSMVCWLSDWCVCV